MSQSAFSFFPLAASGVWIYFDWYFSVCVQNEWYGFSAILLLIDIHFFPSNIVQEAIFFSSVYFCYL